METRKRNNEEPKNELSGGFVQGEDNKTSRDEKPSEKQLSFLKSLGYTGDQPQTREEAFALINEGVEMKKETPTEHVMTQLVFVDVPLFDSKKRVLAQMQINMHLSEGFQLQRDWDYDGGAIMVMVKWGIKPTEENIQWWNSKI